VSEPVAITGWAFASPFGTDEASFWEGLCHGAPPLSTWRSEPMFPGLECGAAQLPGPAGSPADRVRALATDLARRALAHAGHAAPPAGLGMGLGSYWGEIDYLALPPRPAPPPLLPLLARDLGLSGPTANLPVACASGNYALAWAAARIRRQDAPVMLAGGLDVIGPAAVGGYIFLDNLCAALPLPFSPDRDGFLLSEGGALFVLEPRDAARAAGRPIRAVLRGYGNAHDASHPTRPDPAGGGLVRAMRQALARAGLGPADIGYVNAHAPGTIQNDPGEAAALREVFGPAGVPVSSTKAVLGHAQGGANALEALACILALQRGLAPPTRSVAAADPALELDVILGAPREFSPPRALSLASSLGGATSAVILERGAQ